MTMTMTRAWWVLAAGMLLTGFRTVALHLVNLSGLGRGFSHVLLYAARGVFYVGLAVAAVGVVQLVRAAAGATR